MRTALLCLLACSVLAPAHAQPVVRIVSLNVCADQLLLELADPEQVLALTHLSTDSDASYHHRRAASYAQTQRSAEEVLALAPTRVIASSYGQGHTIALLRQQGLTVDKMPIAQTLEQVYENIEQVGDWLGQQTRSGALVTRLKDRVATLPETTSPTPLAVIYDANGYTVGAQSLRGQMLELAGFHNLASDLGIGNYGKINLETLIARRPEVIVDSPFSSDTWSRAQALPKHPALRRSGLAPQVIPLVVNSTICAGPWTVDNIETLAKFRLSMQNPQP